MGGGRGWWPEHETVARVAAAIGDHADQGRRGWRLPSWWQRQFKELATSAAGELLLAEEGAQDGCWHNCRERLQWHMRTCGRTLLNSLRHGG